MRVRHLTLRHDRVTVSLKDYSPQRNLWELTQGESTHRLTRFPKLYPVNFEGPYRHRFEAMITEAIFLRVIAAHREEI